MDKYRKLGIIGLLYGLLFLGFLYLRNTDIKNSGDEFLYSESNLEVDQELMPEGQSDYLDQDEDIYVHISGEVHYPGLIKVEKGARLFEAIDKAGGMTENSDPSRINLAKILDDEEKIHVPSVGEEDFELEVERSDSKGLISINSASKEELMTLPGVGEKTAESIIDYRKDNKFSSIEDIMDVPGIGQGKFEQMKSKIKK